MPRGAGPGPMGPGPLGRRRWCSADFTANSPSASADDLENQAKQLERRSAELRAKAKRLRGRPVSES